MNERTTWRHIGNDEAAHRGIPIADLSHPLDGREYAAFWDYGHLERPDDFLLWEPALARSLHSTASKEIDPFVLESDETRGDCARIGTERAASHRIQRSPHHKAGQPPD
jgi:hypothetical protein